MVVTEKMEEAVHQQPPHFPVVGRPPAKRLPEGDCGGDHDLAEKWHPVPSCPAILETQHISSVVPSAKPTVQVTHRAFADDSDGEFAGLGVEGDQDSDTEAPDRATPDTKSSLPVGHLHPEPELLPHRYGTP
jgi:hypothetical protein